ncbi:MAG: hypothetical protein OXH70_17675 [Acidobacteria bacterium]|nr:hypothetical protein [Acidobacteriota bacterium]
MTTEIAKLQTVERVDSYVELPLGSYWKARHGREAAAGELVILSKVHTVDKEPHSVTVVQHPDLWRKYDNWGGRDRYMDQHRRYLVDDFIDEYEHDPEGAVKRQRLLAAAQSEVNDQLALLPSNPAAPTNLESVEKAQDSMVKLTAYAEDATAQLERVEASMEPVRKFLEEQSMVAEIMSDAVQGQLKKISSKLQTIGLYTGNGVVVRTFKEGTGAKPSEPVCLFQRRLYMDEESLIHLHRGGADFRDMQAFGKQLNEDPKLVERVIPAERAVVAMQIRRNLKDYGTKDPWLEANLNKEYKRAFLLIRDGENLHAVFSSIKIMHQLFPNEGEFEEPFHVKGDSFFKRKAYVITPESLEYPGKKHEADELALYYRRILILLSGLSDRLGLLGQFEGGRPNLYSIESQERFFRFVHDKEKVLADGRPNFWQWIKYHNDKIESGDEVACYWDKLITAENAPGCWSRHWHNPERYFTPKERIGVSIARRQKDRHYIKVPVEGGSWGYHDTDGWYRKWSYREREFDAKVMLPESSNDGWGQSFTHLRLKEADPEDLVYYMENREARSNYLSIIPGIAAMLELLEGRNAA